jgi:Pyridoxamine 5'-phosphate oxidase
MIEWPQFRQEAPETAAVFERRLAATGLALMATLRADGAPRISPLEPLLGDDRLWLGMMPGSTKTRDLARDPRLCLHSATADKDVADGDAKLWGRGVAADDDDTRARYADAFKAATGNDLGELPGGFSLFWVDLTGGSSLVLGDDRQHLRITSWSPGEPERITKRY